MSRSYKKVTGLNPVNKKYGKRKSNKAIRKYNKEISNNGNYKKLYDSYNIADWGYTFFSEKELNDWTEDKKRNHLFRNK